MKKRTHAPSASPSISRSANGEGRPEHQQGARVVGLWPDVSRTLLAGELGVSVSSVSGWLSGRRRMPLDKAIRAAGLVGVGVEEFGKALEGERGRRNGKRRGKKA